MRSNYKFMALGIAMGGLLATGGTALAQTAEQGVQLTQTQIGAAQAQAAQAGTSDLGALPLDARERAEARIWGITDEEEQRVKMLRLGPRGSFSVPGISPLEILGIHAQTEAERRKYAEMFARAQYQDVQRVLAFQRAFDAEMARLTAGVPMVSFKGLPKVDASAGAADLLGVPRSQLIGGGAGNVAGGGQQP